jgi:sec-independent protein translocase protein TatC
MSETPPPAQSSDVEMSIWDHLEELRWVVIKAVIGIVVGVIICAIFGEQILNYVILYPTKNTTPKMDLYNPEVFGQLSLYMEIAIWGGVILAFPYTLIQIWKFISPGLKDKEKLYVRQISFFTVLSFIVGLAFAYWVMLPMALDFAADFGTRDIRNLIDIHKYLGIFLEIIIIAGLVFELPLVSFFLSKLGILTPTFMRHYRKHTIVVLLFLAAILSPGGNPILQIVLFIPLWTLFELSIVASAIVARQKRRDAATAIVASESDAST